MAIEHDRIETFAAQKLKRASHIVCRAYPIAELEQHAANHQLIDGVVIDQQYRAVMGGALGAMALRRCWAGRRLRQGLAHAHGQLETAALARHGLVAQPASHQFRQLSADGQANTKATVLPGHGSIELIEALVQRGFVQVAKADATVADREGQFQDAGVGDSAIYMQIDDALAGELNAVVEQASQAQAQFLRIARHLPRQASRCIDCKCQAFTVGVLGKLQVKAIEQSLQAECFMLGIQLARLQFGEDEDLINHAHHIPRRPGGRLLILLELGAQGHGLHQLQRTDDPVHRRAQFVSHRRQELVLEPVAVGQLLVEHFELLPGIEQRLRLLLAHAVDAVGQGQRQQANFQCRTDLAGVHGDEHIRQIAQHHQRIDHPTQQKGRPGNDEVAGHAQPSPPGNHASGEDRHGKQQRQQRGQAQGQAVTHGQGKHHHDHTVHHQGQQQAV
ncbi:hypothetical protein D3C80_822970 [compost metagenome]